MKKRKWKKPGEKMNVSHEEGRKRGKEEFEGLCLNVWRPRHLQHATSPFPEHFFCTQVGEKLSGKSEPQSSKKRTGLWKRYKDILSKAHRPPLSSDCLSALWECCCPGTVTVIPEVCSHPEQVLHLVMPISRS